MKKIISLMLVFCLICSCLMLSSCKSTAEKFNEGVKKTDALDSYDVRMKMNIKVSRTEVPMTIDMKIQNAHSESPIFSADFESETNGKTAKMEIYSDGEWVYVDSGHEDGTGKVPFSKFKDSDDYNDDFSDFLKPLPESIFNEVEPVQNKDGSQTVTIEMPTVTFKSIYKDLYDRLGEKYFETMLGTTKGDVSVESATVTMTLEESGYISKYGIDYTMKFTLNDYSVQCSIKISLSFDNPGEPVEVKPMKDCESFPEIELP